MENNLFFSEEEQQNSGLKWVWSAEQWLWLLPMSSYIAIVMSETLSYLDTLDFAL